MRPLTACLQTVARSQLLTYRAIPTRRFPQSISPRQIQIPIRSFTQTHRYGQKNLRHNYDNSNARPAEELNNNVTQEEKADWARKVEADKVKQIRTPWHREGSETPPVHQQREASAMTKGKLLTTPSRMLKLILPLTTSDTNSDRKDVEPLALLVHPQQPLSYLERLIQAELPAIETEDGKERIPHVYFRAEDSMQDSLEPSNASKTPISDESRSVVEDRKEGAPDRDASKQEKDEKEAKDEENQQLNFEKADETRIGNSTEKTGKLSSGSAISNRKDPSKAEKLRGTYGEGGVESYSGLGHEAPADSTSKRKFVRWSSSTEIGDFIRDAARGQEFAVEIEGAPNDIRVGVPSFSDRTYYLRMRLRKASRKIADMAALKKECDELAHKGAQRVALCGFGILATYWVAVYQLTFGTELGWDVMEPVTYLVGLSTLIAGYVWFLYHNREVSYRSAMNFTISRRQSKLYTARGFDLNKWQMLIDEGNALRREIKAVANEYDVEWDELEDEKKEAVAEALKDEREKQKKNGKDGDEDEDEGGKKK